MDKQLLRKVERQAWFLRFPRGLPLLLLALVVAITLQGVGVIERGEGERRKLALERDFTEVSFALYQREAEHVAYLRAAAALFTRAPVITQSEFARFHSDLSVSGQQLGALGIGWTERYDYATRQADIARLAALSGPHWQFRPAPVPARAAGFPIVFLLPDDSVNRRALGYDMYSEPVRRAAMDAAARLGRPVATGKVTLVQDIPGPQPGFLIFMPVFSAPGHRLRGFVYSPFRAGEFLESANGLRSDRSFGIAIYDERREPARVMARSGEIAAGRAELVRTIAIAGRTWVVVVSEPRPPLLSSLSFVTLLGGISTGLLLALLVSLMMRRAAQDRQVLEWLQTQQAIRTSLTRELNHRVKNTLANVLSIIALTRRRATDLDSFATSLTGRIRALSATHDLLTRSDWAATPLRAVIQAELAPYLTPGGANVALAGPPIELAPNDALSFGLALHELTTNAAKHGSLSVPDGRVEVSWRLVTPDVAEVVWREAGGPPVREPVTQGFGRELIERIVAHELRAPVDLRFAPTGVECRLRVPVRKDAPFELRANGGSGE